MSGANKNRWVQSWLLGTMALYLGGCGLFGSGEHAAEYVNSDLHVNGNLYVTGKIIAVSEEHAPASDGHAAAAGEHGHGAEPGHGPAAGGHAPAHGAVAHAQGGDGHAPAKPDAHGHAPSQANPGEAGHGGHHGGGPGAGAGHHGQAAGAAAPTGDWAYDGPTGPTSWANLKPEFAKCGSGHAQSPIDIDHAGSSTMGPIEFSYTQMPLKIENDGYTVNIDGSRGGWIEFAAKRFELKRLQFHSPSEHRVRGRTYDMVGHLVHESSDGEVLYIGVPFVRGKKNRALESMWKHFPLRKGESSTHNDVIFSVEALLPDRRSYYSYIGSLTRPPCTEGVRWVFLKSPLTVSAAQIARFKRTFPNSVRPVQQLHGRTVGQGR